MIREYGKRITGDLAELRYSIVLFHRTWTQSECKVIDETKALEKLARHKNCAKSKTFRRMETTGMTAINKKEEYPKLTRFNPSLLRWLTPEELTNESSNHP